jgi:outer membrane protein assembly complex protein YaeT
VLALALGAAAAARAAAPVPPPAPVESDDDDADADAEAEAPAVAPAAPAARVPIRGYELAGARIDPDDKLKALLATVAPAGEPFVEAGPSDEIGKPLGTIPRLVQALDAVGYRAAIAARREAGGVTLVATLSPYDRLRYVFVSGNWPLLQDEIQRRISIRPGRALPPPGPERQAALERERERVIEFLRSEGYFEATLALEARPVPTVPGATDFYLKVDLGPSYPIGPLTFTGNHALSTAEIEPMFRHFSWYTLWITPSPFTRKRLREDIEALQKRYRALGYIGVRVTSDFSVQKSVDRVAKNVRLAIHINERKRITVAFEGNGHESSSTLRDELTLYARGAYDDVEVGASADALARFYQSDGFFLARVDWRRERLSADEERVVFVIDEGPRLPVRGIDFAGNRSIPSGTLAEVVSVRTFPLLGDIPVIGDIGLGSGGYVTARQLEQDSERLVDFYKGRGFLEVKVRGDAATVSEALGQLGAVAAGADTAARDADRLYVRFTIDEGPRITLASEDFRTGDGSALPYDKTFLTQSTTLKPGAPYTPGALREDGKRLSRLLGDAGYPSSTVEPEVSRVGDRATLTWVLKLGPKTWVGPIFVRGNFVTHPDAILEWIPIASGDVLTTTATERGQRNLGALQLFNNASPISFPGKDDKRPVVPMVVEVEERYDQYSVLHVGAGISTAQKPPDSSLPFGIYARAGYDNRNLLGNGWQSSLQATYGTSLFTATGSFLDRRFLGTLFRLDAALTYLSQATVRLGDIHSGGGSVGFSREMYPGVDAGIHYNLRSTTHTEDLIRQAGPDEAQQTVTLGTTVGSISANVQWLRVDNRLLPSRGFRIDAIAELALPALSVPLRVFPVDIGDDTFLKVGIHSLTVIPLGRHLFLRQGFRYDQGFPLAGASLLPKVETYFAGGDTTIRGYELDRARVEVVAAPIIRYPCPTPQMPARQCELDQVQYRPLGGNLRILHNLDLQFPISPPWYGSIFIDSGVVADSLDGLSPAKFRHGAGIAPLVIRLPIGDISLGWAWPLDPGPGDTKIGVFIVNVGLQF